MPTPCTPTAQAPWSRAWCSCTGVCRSPGDVRDQAQPDRRAHSRAAAGPAHQLGRSAAPATGLRRSSPVSASPSTRNGAQSASAPHGHEAVAVAAHMVEADLGDHREVAGDHGLVRPERLEPDVRDVVSHNATQPAGLTLFGRFLLGRRGRRRTPKRAMMAWRPCSGSARGSRARRPRRTPQRSPPGGSGRHCACTAPACRGTPRGRRVPRSPRRRRLLPVCPASVWARAILRRAGHLLLECGYG